MSELTQEQLDARAIEMMKAFDEEYTVGPDGLFGFKAAKLEDLPLHMESLRLLRILANGGLPMAEEHAFGLHEAKLEEVLGVKKDQQL